MGILLKSQRTSFVFFVFASPEVPQNFMLVRLATERLWYKGFRYSSETTSKSDEPALTFYNGALHICKGMVDKKLD